MDVLYIAEKWGSLPWEITGESATNRTRQTWYKRARAYYAKIEKKRAAMLENK